MRGGSLHGLAVTALVIAALSRSVFAATSDLPVDPPPDPAPCVAAIAAGDDDRIVTICGTLIDNEKTLRPDRLKALIARAGSLTRKDQPDRAIADYDVALRLDPKRADLFNARGELWRQKGDRPRAIRDFAAAVKLDPQNEVARGNHKALALEIERLGAAMAIKDQPKPPLK